MNFYFNFIIRNIIIRNMSVNFNQRFIRHIFFFIFFNSF